MRYHLPTGTVPQRGVTLPELLISMTVMVLVAGVVSACYFASMRVWQRCSSQSQSDPPAHMTIDRVSSELKNAYLVDSLTPTALTFTIPLRDDDGINILPLQSGTRVSYYLSDESGGHDAEGTCLWREATELATGTQSQMKLAGNVEQLTFDCDATETRVLKIYAMSITVVGQEGLQQHHTQFESHIALRN